MNILICHVTKNSLKKPDTESYLFRPFNEISFFESALKTYNNCKDISETVFVCPHEDADFITAKINNFIFCSEFKNFQYKIAVIHKNDPAAFSAENLKFNPVLMTAKDMFGFWNAEYFENFTKNQADGNFLIFNMESFWFLKEKHISEMFHVLKQFDFSFSLHTQEDIIAGVNIKRAKPFFIKITNKKKQILNIFRQNLSVIHKNLPADEISSIRDKNIGLINSENNCTLNFIDNAAVDFSILSPLIAEIRSEIFSVSLRNQFGINIFSKIGKILSDIKNSSAPFKPSEYMSGRSICPLVFRTELDNSVMFDKNLFFKIIEVWNFTPFYILEDKNTFTSNEYMPLIINHICRNSAGKVYLESASFSASTEQLKLFFKNGLSAYVLLADEYLKAYKEGLTNINLNEKIKSLLSLKQEFKNIFILIKIKNNSNDTRFIHELLCDWQFISDGIIITPDYESSGEFLSAQDKDSCTKVPYEVILRPDLTISLCAKSADNKTDPLNISSWETNTLKAGFMDICRNCSEKYRFRNTHYETFSASKLEPFIMNYYYKNRFDRIDKHILNNEFNEALACIENILKNDPANITAAEKIEIIKNKSL